MNNPTPESTSNSLTKFLTVIAAKMEVEKACFLEYVQAQGLLSCSACVGIDDVTLLTRWGDGLAGWVAEQGSCKIINDIRHTPELPDELSAALAENSFLAAPLYHDNELLGVIILAGKKDTSAFDTNDRQRLIDIIPLLSWTIYYLTTTPPSPTTLHQLESQLQQIQTERQALVDYIKHLVKTLDCAMLMVDDRGKISRTNKAAEKLLNLTNAKLEGASIGLVFGDDIQQMVLESTQKPTTAIKETEFINSDGKRVTTRISCCAYSNRQHQPEFMVVLHHDTAKTKETPSQDRLASIGELTAGIAHELRNPLAGIMTTAETLKENFEPGDSRKEYLVRIINEINRMNQFLIRFFAFTRPQKPQKRACSLPQIIDRIVDLEAQNISHNNISVVKEYQPSLPDIKLDANQMQQVFLNLILNSVQAMPDGGELKISIQADNGRDKSEPPGYIQVDVSDTGIGIKPQDLNKIFTPFHTTKPKGVGLGLAVSRRILDEHKGKAWVNSRVGQGTTFSIKLPL